MSVLTHRGDAYASFSSDKDRDEGRGRGGNDVTGAEGQRKDSYDKPPHSHSHHWEKKRPCSFFRQRCRGAFTEEISWKEKKGRFQSSHERKKRKKKKSKITAISVLLGSHQSHLHKKASNLPVGVEADLLLLEHLCVKASYLLTIGSSSPLAFMALILALMPSSMACRQRTA